MKPAVLRPCEVPEMLDNNTLPSGFKCPARQLFAPLPSVLGLSSLTVCFDVPSSEKLRPPNVFVKAVALEQQGMRGYKCRRVPVRGVKSTIFCTKRGALHLQTNRETRKQSAATSPHSRW